MAEISRHIGNFCIRCKHNLKIKSDIGDVEGGKMLLSPLIPNRLRTVRYSVLSPDLVSVAITNKPVIVRAKAARNTSLEGI